MGVPPSSVAVRGSLTAYPPCAVRASVSDPSSIRHPVVVVVYQLEVVVGRAVWRSLLLG